MASCRGIFWKRPTPSCLQTFDNRRKFDSPLAVMAGRSAGTSVTPVVTSVPSVTSAAVAAVTVECGVGGPCWLGPCAD